MLQKIIGGIALVAIGYGLKTFVDEYGILDEYENDTDENSHDDEETAQVSVEEN